jgi:hypothetical protein
MGDWREILMRSLLFSALAVLGLASCADFWGFHNMTGAEPDAGSGPWATPVSPEAGAGAGREAGVEADAGCEGGGCGIPSGTAVLFGGEKRDLSDLNDTWTFDGYTWTLVPFPNPPPAASEDMWSMAALGHEVVLFGGYDAATKWALNETWVFDGSVWRMLQVPNPPPPRSHSAMATFGDRVVLFGGEGYNGALNDTWTFDGAVWTKLDLPQPPRARSGASMVAWEGRLILVGGLWDGPIDGGSVWAKDTWAFDGRRWMQLNAPGLENAESGYLSSLAVQNHRLVLVGGELPDGASTQTWTFEGASWTLLTVPSPRPVDAPMFAYGQDLILFAAGDGPSQQYMDAWRFDGTRWSLQPLSNPPSERSFPHMALIP